VARAAQAAQAAQAVQSGVKQSLDGKALEALSGVLFRCSINELIPAENNDESSAAPAQFIRLTLVRGLPFTDRPSPPATAPPHQEVRRGGTNYLCVK